MTEVIIIHDHELRLVEKRYLQIEWLSQTEVSQCEVQYILSERNTRLLIKQIKELVKNFETQLIFGQTNQVQP